ncbi:hypothetical protein ACFL1Z_02090 [Thermodesulfobacteriota bacterium]
MINLEIETKISEKEIMSRVKSFFGKGGLGLDIAEETEACLGFTGGGGYVKATICDSGDKKNIELVSQEWEQQVKKFASELS